MAREVAISVKKKTGDFLRSDAGAVLLLSLLTLLVRLLTLPVIEDSGDHIFYWTAAKKLFLSGCAYDLNHWSSRFGVVLPVFLSQIALGTQPLTMYALPLAMSVLQTVALYYTGLHAGGKKTAIAATLVMLLYPTMVRNGSHILPGIFSSAYITFAALCMFKYLDSEGKLLRYLVASAVLLFAAYETHIICVFVIPGFMLVLWKGENRLKDLAVFAGAMAVMVLSEFLLYYIYTGSLLGQLGVIIHSHVENNESLAPTTFAGLFYRFIRPGPHFTAAFAVYLAACVYLLKKGRTAKVLLLLYSSLFFFFALTFAVKSVDPITPVINSQIRYFDPVLPFFFCIIIIFALDMIRGSARKEALARRAFVFLVLAALGVYAFHHRGNFSRHSLAVVCQNNELADFAFAGGIPFVYSSSDSADYLRASEMLGENRERPFSREMSDRYGATREDYIRLRSHHIRMNRSFRVLKSVYCNDCPLCSEAPAEDSPQPVTASRNGRRYLAIFGPGKKVDAAAYFSNPSNKVVLVDRLPTTLRASTAGGLESSPESGPAK